MGALLAIVTALLIIAARVLGAVVRFAYRHRHVVPYVDVALAGLGALAACVILGVFIGDTPALILTAAAAVVVWLLRDSILIRFKWWQAVKTVDRLQPVRIRSGEQTRAGWWLLVRFSKGQTAGKSPPGRPISRAA